MTKDREIVRTRPGQRPRVYSRHDRDRLPATSASAHRPALRARLPDLPLTDPHRTTLTAQGPHHDPHPRRASSSTCSRSSAPTRCVTDADVLQQRSIDNFRKLAEHLRRLHDAVARGGRDGAQHRRGRQGARLRRRARRQRGAAHRRHRDRGRARDARSRTRSCVDGSGMNQIVERSTPTTCRPPRSAACRCRCSRTEARKARPHHRPLAADRSRSPRWAASSRPAASASSRRSTAASRTWSSGCEVVFPGGQVSRIKNVPRRAAGPDIRHIVIGNEGALCFITEVTVKLFPYLPENNMFLGWTLKNMKDGLRGAARGDGRRLQAVGRPPLRPRGRPAPLLALRRSPTTASCCSWPRATPASPRRRPRASSEIVAQHPGCEPVDSAAHRRLVRRPRVGSRQDHRRGRAHPHDPQRQPHHRDLRRLELDQRDLRGGAATNPGRDHGHHAARRSLVAQLHQRHEHVLQLLLRPHRL